MTALPDLFPGFATRRFKTRGAEIHARIGGSGPPLVLLHGYPQTHVCWHRIAPELAKHVTLILPDLRGYGESSAPPGGASAGDPDHQVYSKRAMALDVIDMMRELGHDRFMLGGHDRGARVAYRLALDHPTAVSRLIILDILPTRDAWLVINGMKAYHWYFLAQPAPLPETLISADPAFYVEKTLASWAMTGTLDTFAPAALMHYRAALANPERVHAVCEDYRAGATCDVAADNHDHAVSNIIACPTQVLWGSEYVGKGSVPPLYVWNGWCSNLVGKEIRSGHFLAEENPSATLAAMLPFVTAAGAT